MRYKYIDNTKGLAIILMIFAHTMTINNGIKIWIFSFHMPIFFIINGILFQKKFERRSPEMEDIKILFIKRARQLGVPYLFFCLLLTMFYCGLSVLSGKSFDIVGYMFKIITLQGIDSLWFIPCFFFAELTLVIVLVSRRTKIAGEIGTLALVGYLIFFSQKIPHFWLLRFLIKVMVGFVFSYIGYWIGKKKLVQKLPFYGAIFILVVGIIFSQINGLVGIGSLEFQNSIMFLFDAVISSLAMLALFYCSESSGFKEFKILTFFGRDTIVLLCTNNLLIETIRLIDYKFVGNILLSWGLIGSIILTLFLLILESAIIKLSQGSIGIIFGKKGKR